MAASDIERFHFYHGYLWTEDDFSNFQTWLDATIAAIPEGAFGAGVLTGFNIAPVSGLIVSVANGIAVNADGKVLIGTSLANQTFTSPVGNPAWSLLVARSVDTDQDYITNPEDPEGPTVPLHSKRTMSLVVINGTPAGSPAYPSIVAGDVIIAAVKLTSGQTTITTANFDWHKVDRPKSRVNRVKKVIASETLDGTENFVEGDCTSGAVTLTLPNAAASLGKMITITKIDSTASALSVTTADLISGQTTVSIDDQWGFVRVYSNGISWRQI